MSVAKMRCRKWVTVTTTILVNMYRQVVGFVALHREIITDPEEA